MGTELICWKLFTILIFESVFCVMHSVSTFMILARISTWFNEIVKILGELSCGKIVEGPVRTVRNLCFLGNSQESFLEKYSLKVKPEG